jgi:branched-chain amino acid transport system permease protein
MNNASEEHLFMTKPMNGKRRIGGRLPLYAGGLLFLLVFPYIAPYKALASNALIFMLFAMAYDLCLGYAGMLSFGHAAFFGVGAYTTGLLITRADSGLIVSLAAGTAAGFLIAIPIGWLAIRRRGIYFAMVTLAFSQLIYFIAFKWVSLTGGDDGLQGVPRPDLFGMGMQSEARMYFLILIITAGFVWFADRLVRSPFGQALVAIRDNEQRARSIGFNPAGFKLVAFTVSAGLSGLAGGMYCLLQNFVPLKSLHWSLSGEVVMMTILGGMGTLIGPFFGGLFIVMAREVLSTYTQLWALIMGISFIVIILIFRKGIVGEFKDKLSL